ncbi:MAG: HlyC/CorC family transporter [Alphaproteobacteria bacterium]|nr:HlyC/CorC family transporter [Alphaproteobacteria bacterium]MBQ7286010.1 HlyC/CorC family transporter [Alphaproteobacteria bacterium]
MSDETKNESSFCSFVSNLFKHKQPETVRETIEDLIEEADGDQEFSEHEQLLLNNILCLRDKKCGNAMIPRADIIGFPKDGNIVDLAELMVTKGHSRIPIYGESLDDIVGIVHVIDLMKCMLNGKKDTKVSEIITNNVKFVSPSMRVLDLLRQMQLQKVHMAMVVDEYGGIDGLVTIEDLLEEIVGDIEDEYDFDENHIIAIQDNGEIIADAKAELDEIKEQTGLDLTTALNDEEKEDIDTLGGLVFQIAQRIPSRGEIIDGNDGLKFRILEVDPRRIKKVLIMQPKELPTVSVSE